MKVAKVNLLKYIGQFIFVPSIDLIAVIIAQDEYCLYYIGKSSICYRHIDIGDLSEVVFGVIGSFEEVSSKRKGLLVEYKLYNDRQIKEAGLNWEKVKVKESLIKSSEF